MALQVALLEESFDLVAAQGGPLMEQMNRRLGELDPRLASLFAPADRPGPGRMLLGTLVLLRASWHHLDPVVPALVALGAHYRDHGLGREHYGTLGIALLDALAATAGSAWHPEYVAAWAEAYTVLWDIMVESTGIIERREAARGVLVA